MSRLVSATLFLVASALVSTAGADIPPAFTVADVPVDATADNSVAARAAALAEGEAAAFHQLMQRLVSPADAGRLPPADAGTVTNMVADYQVSNEHSSAVRYIAEYTFRFNPKSVRDYLHGLGIAFTELASRPVVIVPVLTLGGAAHLWDEPNPWRDAWNAVPGKSGLVPWVVPAGDIEDVADFDLANVADPAPEKLAALAAHYGGGDVVVASATESDAGSRPALQITLTRYGATGDPVVSEASASADAADASLYRAGVAAAAGALETAWKNVTFSAPSLNDQTTEISVPVAGIADWGRVRARLAGVPIVHQITIDFMARDEVRATLKYAGDTEALRIALAQQNLTMTDSVPYPMVVAAPDSGRP